MWFEVDSNPKKWEKGPKAKEQCIVMTHWLASANRQILQNNS
jgi:hypothetical protein